MSQEKRVIGEISENELVDCNDKQQQQQQQVQQNPDSNLITNTVRKTAKKRGRINVNACHRCRRDKKKCDGNYSTKITCKYCRHHKVECTYPEPGRKRVKLIQHSNSSNNNNNNNNNKVVVAEDKNNVKIKFKDAKKINNNNNHHNNKKILDHKRNQIKDIHERIIKVEENLFDVTELLANVRQQQQQPPPLLPSSSSFNIREIIKQIFFRLLISEFHTAEQTLLLRELWICTAKIMNCPANEDYLYALYKKLQFLESDQEEIKSHMWKEIQIFVDRCNNNTNNSCENEHPLATTTSFTSEQLYTTQHFPSPHISPEFNNNNNNYLNVSILKDTKPIIQSLTTTTTTTTTTSSPIVPSQRSPNVRINNEFSWTRDIRNDDNLFSFDNNNNNNNNDFTSSPNLISYIDSQNQNDKLNNNEYFQNLTANEGTTFLCFQSTNSSPLFSSNENYNDNINIPTFNSLQPSPSLNPIGLSYGPTDSITDYIHIKQGERFDKEIVQYPQTSNF